MSALPPKADSRPQSQNVRFGPLRTCQLNSWAALVRKLSLDTALQFSPNSARPMNFLCLTVVNDLPTQVTLIGKS